MDVKYFVRTTGERSLDETFSQIKYELLIDKEHNPVKSFIEQLEYLSDYDAVLLEDDVVLCEGFKEEIEKVISNHKDSIINFFTNPIKYFTPNYCQCFIYNQCTYYPKGVGKILAKQMRQDWKKLKGVGYDSIENRSINTLNLYVYNYRPCLVQHKDTYSLIGRNRMFTKDRITPYFKDYIDKYNIDYNNPKEALANLDKLNNEKEEFINQIKADVYRTSEDYK